jgi:hypothetical protein
MLRLTALAFLCACSAPPAAPCTPSCATEPPSCSGCPSINTELCTNGVCELVAAATVDLNANVSVDRSLATDLRSLWLGVFAVVGPQGERGCDDIGPGSDNVLDGTLINASGAFHPELRLGRVPAGLSLAYVEARDQEGQRQGAGCVQIDAVAPSTTIEVITVR